MSGYFTRVIQLKFSGNLLCLLLFSTILVS